MASKSHIALNSSKVLEYSSDYWIWVQPKKHKTFCAMGHFGHVCTIIFKNYNSPSCCLK